MNNIEEEQQKLINARAQFEMSELMNSCPAKSIIGITMGAALGAVFGLFLGSNEYAMDEKFLKLSMKEQTKITLQELGSRAKSTSKAFATFSGVFVTTECLTEAVRGKDDRYNSMIAGCTTGAILAHKGI